MDDVLEQVGAHASRSVAGLTRRDVARWLTLTVDAREGLPALRQALIAAGNPLSAAFWQSADQLLARMEVGTATVGEVRRWIEASGSEPTQIIGLLVWDEQGERLPVADQLYGELVEHLEGLVRAGAIDPDQLLSGDPAATAAYVEVQERWLDETLPGGATRREAILDEEDEGLLEDWAAADAESLALLEQVLERVGVRPCLTAALGAVCDRLRTGLASDESPYDLLATCAGLPVDLPEGLPPEGLPEDDEALWLALAAGVVNPRDEPPDTYDVGPLSAWAALMHADWLCAVSELASNGPGAPADPEDLAQYVQESDVVEGELTDDDVDMLSFGFVQVVELWRTLGAVGRDGRLTPLGWWGLPEAQRRAWAASPQ